MRWVISVVTILAVVATVEGVTKITKLRGELSAHSSTDAVVETLLDASHIVENERGQWHVYSDTLTQKAHEGISLAAANRVGGGVFDLEGLRTGSIWNDMPSGVETEEAAMIADGHLDVDTWSRLFFQTGGVDDLVYNVHYGCMQHFHSMAPIQRRQTKDSPASRIVFTNEDVRGFTIGQMKQWWDLAKQTPTNKKRFSWYMGHILHTLQDSYPRGHVVRDSTDSTCGKIVLFQGYDAQHGNGAHKIGDYTPSSTNKETDPSLTKRYNCAVDFSTKMLQCFTDCVRANGAGDKCEFNKAVRPWLLTDVYAFMDDKSRTRVAGGSRVDFAQSNINAPGSGFKAESLTIAGHGVIIYNPVSTQLWSRKSAVRVCDGTGPILSKAPTSTLGVKHYNEKPFNQYINYNAPNNQN